MARYAGCGASFFSMSSDFLWALVMVGVALVSGLFFNNRDILTAFLVYAVAAGFYVSNGWRYDYQDYSSLLLDGFRLLYIFWLLYVSLTRWIIRRLVS